jgi:uncharacterized protein (DUF305 family)
MAIRTTLAGAAGALVLAASLTGCASASTDTAAGGATPVAAATASSSAAADIAFAQLMIPHHQQAIVMADMALASATTPEVEQLATQIKAAQDPEIQQMTAWLQEWGAPTAMPGGGSAQDMADMDHGGHDMGGMTGAGMMSAEEMAELGGAMGGDFDTMWLQMMIAHHEGAVVMAEQVLTTTEDERVRELAEAIITGQTAEIDTMRQLLPG